MTNQRILIVEDRINILTLITDYLVQQNYDVSQAQNGIDALKLCRTHTYDCVLLDLMMPQMDGMTFLHELRRISTVPVIVMSAKLEEVDKIEALNAGADEYITKPVGMREVVARVQAIIRRVNNMPALGRSAPQNQINALSFDEYRRTVFLNNNSVSLTNTEYKIITPMLKNIGKIITRQEFGQMLYGSDAIKLDRSIDMHIKNIRHKIEPDQDNPIYIVTIYGVGYRMNTTVAQWKTVL